MSTEWLRKKLDEESSAATDGGDPILTVSYPGGEARVYCPSSADYNIDSDLVDKVRELGGTTISYPSWSGPTHEARSYSASRGIQMLKHAEFFAFLRKKGVTFAE